MALEPIFEKLNVIKESKTIEKRIKSECKTDVNSADVKKIINVYAVADVVNTEVENGKVKTLGRINYFICYENEQGEIAKSECGCEFLEDVEIENASGFLTAEAVASVYKTELNTSGIKLTITGYVEIKITLKCAEEVVALVGGDGLIADTTTVSVVRPLGARQTNYPVSEEFEIPLGIKEVINHTASAVITSTQCGVGVVIVDGEVYLSLTALTTDGKVVKESKAFPFRAEVEQEEAMPAFPATAKVKVKSFKTDIAVSGENESTAKAEIVLVFEATAYECKEQTIAVDVFSTTNNVLLEKVETVTERPTESRSVIQKVKGEGAIDGLEEGVSFGVITGENVEITAQNSTENGVKVTGVISGSAIFTDAENKLFSRKIHVPFECELDANLPCDTEFVVSAVIKNATAKMLTETEIEIEAEVVFLIACKEKAPLKVIGRVEDKGEKKIETSAISVYIAGAGETLWQLAKRLNVCPSELLTANKDLIFPLSGEERIVIYRQN